jgi:hypothetical protein
MIPPIVVPGAVHERYIAFLNHNEHWLPDHLERRSAEVERRKADLDLQPAGDHRP